MTSRWTPEVRAEVAEDHRAWLQAAREDLADSKTLPGRRAFAEDVVRRSEVVLWALGLAESVLVAAGVDQ